MSCGTSKCDVFQGIGLDCNTPQQKIANLSTCGNILAFCNPDSLQDISIIFAALEAEELFRLTGSLTVSNESSDCTMFILLVDDDIRVNLVEIPPNNTNIIFFENLLLAVAVCIGPDTNTGQECPGRFTLNGQYVINF